MNDKNKFNMFQTCKNSAKLNNFSQTKALYEYFYKKLHKHIYPRFRKKSLKTT